MKCPFEPGDVVECVVADSRCSYAPKLWKGRYTVTGCAPYFSDGFGVSVEGLGDYRFDHDRFELVERASLPMGRGK